MSASEGAVRLEFADGTKVPVLRECFVGRRPENHVILNDTKVSRRHAVIREFQRGEYWLIDFGTKNGTFLNGSRVRQPTCLASGDEVRFGSFTVVFTCPVPNAGDRDTFVSTIALHMPSTSLAKQIEVTERSVALLDRDTQIISIPQSARRWLEHAFEDTPTTENELPTELKVWILRQTDEENKPARPDVFVRSRDSRRLTVRVELTTEDQIFIALSESRPAFYLLRKLDLTPAETEVVAWIIAGKSNAEIGEIRGVKTRTVEKQVECIFNKLGVDNRVAVITFVLNYIREHGGQ
ncbi:MAG: FHA domain-containing protein [Limisphaerales bacterium]